MADWLGHLRFLLLCKDLRGNLVTMPTESSLLGKYGYYLWSPEFFGRSDASVVTLVQNDGPCNVSPLALGQIQGFELLV